MVSILFENTRVQALLDVKSNFCLCIFGTTELEIGILVVSLAVCFRKLVER
jgi:hypothetical protein